MATFDRQRLSSARLKSLECVGYRNQSPGFDVRGGVGARRFGGRYNPPRSFPVIYLCLTKPCVVAELSALATRQNIQISDLLPREVWSVVTSLEKVLDLTDSSVLASLAVETNGLIRPDHAYTQQIGEAAHERAAQAIKAPSATGVDQVLAIFPENLGATTLHVELIEVWSSVEDLA
ncbi:MAG: RES family NAD+ phosphorylase [Acidimicrobiales bacterium]